MKTWTGAHVEKSPGIVRRVVGEDVILVPTTASGAVDLEYLYRLNATAAFLWDRLDPETPLGELVAELASTFGIDLDIAERDAAAFLADIARSGLFRPVSDHDASLLTDLSGMEPSSDV